MFSVDDAGCELGDSVACWVDDLGVLGETVLGSDAAFALFVGVLVEIPGGVAASLGECFEVLYPSAGLFPPTSGGEILKNDLAGFHYDAYY